MGVQAFHGWGELWKSLHGTSQSAGRSTSRRPSQQRAWCRPYLKVMLIIDVQAFRANVQVKAVAGEGIIVSLRRK